MQPLHVIVEVVPKLVLHPPRGADQRHSHEEEEEPLQRDREQDEAGVARQRGAGGAVLQMVDRLADDPGSPHLEHSRAQDRDDTQDQGEAVALQVGEEMS